MKYNRLNEIDNFRCSQGQCSLTCCAGWCVPIDSQTEAKYRALPGLEGIRMHFNLGSNDDMTVFNPKGGHCHYHTKDGLCSLQLKYGEEYLSRVCFTYPKTLYNFGFYAEEALDLSCPEVAGIFLEADMFSYTSLDKDVEYPRYGTNEDVTYMSLLQQLRNLIVDYVLKENNLPLTYGRLFELGECIQNIFIEERIDPVTDKFMEKILNKSKELLNSPCDPMYIDAKSTDRIMTGGFYHTKLKRTSPYLYKLCRSYFKELDKLSLDNIDTLYKDELYGNEDICAILRKYLAYKIHLKFLEVFEDYCFMRKLTYSVFQTHLLGVMLWLNNKNALNTELDKKDIILTISTVERRSSHREEFSAGIFNQLYKELAR